MLQSAGRTAEVRIGKILVSKAWSRPTPPAATVGAAYFWITNLGGSTDRLISLSSPLASKVEIHESREVNGVAEMREVSFVEFPAGATVKIEPGGLHVMLIGLTRPLIAGATLALSLKFRDAGTVTLQVPVENLQ
jgi:copper(I)-binding protein